MMTRKEFEQNLLARLEDIKALYKQYNPETFEAPNTPYLSMCISDDVISANNRHFKVAENNPDCNHVVDIFRICK